MRANMDGSLVSPLFSHLAKRDASSASRPLRAARDAPCTCADMQLSTTFTMDHSQKQVVEIYVMDRLTNNVWAMDAEGCQCRLVVNASSADGLGETTFSVMTPWFFFLFMLP